MVEDFTLVAKIKADTSELMKEINGVSGSIGKALGSKVGMPKMGGIPGGDLTRAVVGGNSKLLAVAAKAGIVLGAIAVGIGLLVKSSGQLQAALGRLAKTLLLFLKPVGDLLARGVNAVTKNIRDILKDIGPSVEEGGKAGETAGESLADMLNIDGFGKELLASITSAFSSLGWTILGLLGLDIEEWRTFITNLQTEWDKFVSYLTVDIWVDIKEIWNGFTTWVTNEFIPGLKTTWDTFMADLTKLWTDLDTGIRGIIEPIVTWFKDTITTPLVNAWTSFKDSAIAAWEALKKYITDNPIVQIIKQVVSGVTDVVNKTAQTIFGTGQVGISSVANDGLYYLHRGERVVGNTQKSGEKNVTFSPSFSITLTGSGSNKADAEQIYREIMQRMNSELRRLV
jgi:hypothetical protein